MSPIFKFLKPLRFILILVIVVAAYIASIQVTQPDMVKLVTSLPKAKQIMKELVSPEILVQESTGIQTIGIDFPIPCGSAPEGTPITSGPIIQASVPCADLREKFTLTGSNLPANSEVQLRWVLPNGSLFSITRVVTDDKGTFSQEIEARPITATKDGVASRLEADIKNEGGAWVASETFKTVLDAIIVTIFMALLATTIGTLFAVPLGFLAAANITKRGYIGTVAYYIVRSILNVIRSFEPLVMATIFALLVGFGSPFAGVLAMSVVTTASLGKMFSEAVEGIESGPIEAITATGANRFEVILYAVIPQIVPDFLSFTIYHWDINVRISTIIGFVGGGGIGYYLSQRINTFEYTKAGTAILAIIIVVWVLDFVSAEVRKRLV